MALTSSDETDLLIPLHDSSLEAGRFPEFLKRLRQRTRAARASLLVTDGVFSPLLYVALADASTTDPSAGGNAPGAGVLPLETMRPGRAYALDELTSADPLLPARHSEQAGGIVDERLVRVMPQGTLSAWLSLGRTGPCSATDSALLSALAPHLAVAVRSTAAARFDAIGQAITRACLQRSAGGWLAFTADGRVVAREESTAERVLQATGRLAREGERLSLGQPGATRRLAEAVAALAADRQAPPCALTLAGETRIDLVLDRADRAAPGLEEAGLVIGFCRFPDESQNRSPALLADLLGISRREAELAVLVSQGRSLKEAGARMGLTEETARTYSKQLYAKLGLRGQAELVRLVCDSGAALAPTPPSIP